FHGCPPSPDVWGRLSRDPVSNIYRGTATFTALGAGPITASRLAHLAMAEPLKKESDRRIAQNEQHADRPMIFAGLTAPGNQAQDSCAQLPPVVRPYAESILQDGCRRGESEAAGPWT